MASDVTRDPLYDAFFRPTTATAPSRRSASSGPVPPTPAPAASVPPLSVSAAPVRAAGTRSRAGNAMNRTRAALLDGARRAVASNGTRITMAQVAADAGVAKATLYNHFRTREAVLSAVVLDEVEGLVCQFAGLPLADALAGAAAAIAAHPLLRSLAQREPAALAALGRIDPSSAGWQRAQAGVDQALAHAGRAGGELVLRWLASYVLSPGSAAEIAADLAILIASLPDAAPAESQAVIEAKTA